MTFISTFLIIYFGFGVAFAIFIGIPRKKVRSIPIRILSILITTFIWPKTLFQFINMTFMTEEELKQLIAENEKEFKKD